MGMRTTKVMCREVQVAFSPDLIQKNLRFDVLLKYYTKRNVTICDNTVLANLGPCVNKECPFNAESEVEGTNKINVLPHTFEQDGREELFLILRSKEDAEIIKEFLENKTINMMWIEPQNSFDSHALRIEAEMSK